jgi:hypothetical protein
MEWPARVVIGVNPLAVLAFGVVCGMVASVLQFHMLAELNARRPPERKIRWYATGDFGTGWSVWREHQRVFPQSALRRWMLGLWLIFAACLAVALIWLA